MFPCFAFNSIGFYMVRFNSSTVLGLIQVYCCISPLFSDVSSFIFYVLVSMISRYKQLGMFTIFSLHVEYQQLICKSSLFYAKHSHTVLLIECYMCRSLLILIPIGLRFMQLRPCFLHIFSTNGYCMKRSLFLLRSLSIVDVHSRHLHHAEEY